MRYCNVCFLECVALLGALVAVPAQAQAVSSPVAASATTSTPAAASMTLDQLLARFAGMSGLSAKFREEKRMALLAAPLVNEGTLYFAPKGRLARHITSPAPATVLIDEGSLRYADAGGSETLTLDQNPVLRLFVDSFVKIFAGDREALARLYTMELVGLPAGVNGVPRWSLRLRPRVAPMTQVIERIEIEGHEVVLETMRIVEIGGDETLTTFSEVDPQRRFTDQELAALFSLPVRRQGR
ncbi:MAG: outer membrane lipoprotein carrier protein LolA [Nannocystis sp.]|nr:outer membrane lipoprotein carrier protein LolA [Nannocystis sp.]MBA3550540.1 outer membrane lipoprotein carrier protein LolA [Nannocystis sp.]